MLDNAGYFTLEELLEHDAFVRTLAKSLLFDDHQVDEVVQQTYLAALQRRPQREASPRPWLATVAKNFAYQKSRGEKRRQQREQASAKKEISVPSAEEILEREAARKEVIEVVLALEPIYRSILLLRYFEDFNTREIAEHLNLSHETVRTRLKRGLARMRLKLDQKHEGDRRSWCLALIPLAVRAPRTPNPLNPWTGAGTAAALALALWISLPYLAGGDTSTDEIRTARLNLKSAEKPGNSESLQSPEVADASLIRGRILDENFQPIRGARVYLEESDEITPWLEGSIDSDPFKGSEFPRTLSRSNGDFALKSLKGMNRPDNPAWKDLRLAVVAPGYFSALSRPFHLVEVQTGDGVDIVLKKKIPLVGRVVDEKTGEPIAGAKILNSFLSNDDWTQVRRTDGEIRTDAEGRFVDPMGQTGTVRIRAQHDDCIESPETVAILEVSNGQAVPELVLRMKRLSVGMQ